MQFSASSFGASRFGKIGTGAAVAAALVVATALPANAATHSTSITDPKGDTVQQTVSGTKAKVVANKDSYVDITKLVAKRSTNTLKLTIKVAKIKKGYVDAVTVLVRTKKKGTASSILLIAPGNTAASLLSTGGNVTALPASVTLKTKTGKNGTYTVTLPLSVIGSPKSLSVAVSLGHVKSLKKSVTSVDSTGTVKKKSSTIKWTSFLK